MGGFVNCEYNRIKSLLSKDKNNTNNGLSSVLKAEIYNLLSNYMKIDNVDCFANLGSDGVWQIKIVAKTNQFYSIKTTF